MTWVKIDDKARQHRKQLKAGGEACWLWACGLMYCNSEKARDGFIPEEIVPILFPLRAAKRLASRLVEVGLWERIEGGYRVHDYHDYQPDPLQAAEIATKRAEAGRAGGISSGKQRRSKSEAKLEANCFDSGEAKSNPVPVPVPFASDEAKKEYPPTPQGAEVDDSKQTTSAQPPLLLVPDAPKPARRDPVTDVFDHWRERFDHARAVLDDKRKKLIRRAVDRHGLADCLRAIDGCHASPFHRGENDRKKVYDDIELILRDAKNVERFVAIADASDAQADDENDAWGLSERRAHDLTNRSLANARAASGGEQ